MKNSLVKRENIILNKAIKANELDKKKMIKKLRIKIKIDLHFYQKNLYH